MSRRILLATCLSMLAVLSCASHKKPPANVPKIDAPDWYTHPARDNDRLIGVATATSRDLQTAVVPGPDLTFHLTRFSRLRTEDSVR